MNTIEIVVEFARTGEQQKVLLNHAELVDMIATAGHLKRLTVKK